MKRILITLARIFICGHELVGWMAILILGIMSAYVIWSMDFYLAVAWVLALWAAAFWTSGFDWLDRKGIELCCKWPTVCNDCRDDPRNCNTWVCIEMLKYYARRCLGYRNVSNVHTLLWRIAYDTTREFRDNPCPICE